MKLYQRINEKQFSQVLNKLLGILKKKGVEALVDGCCESLPAELDKAAFANACDIVLADGVVDDDEKQFIDDLRRKLNLDKGVAQTIAQVMVIKNKG